ncbi:hypothetical protein HK105_206552 [Polyrhizophydium stewartii]|uniref:Uncharacterized protein n=1 Tax=Polyrhizophydium stewartii TaxID=2732419 RepID=A0ABR4N355_9FUNG
MSEASSPTQPVTTPPPAPTATSDSTNALIPLSLLSSEPAVAAAVALVAAAILMTICASAFFIRRGVNKGFTPAFVALVTVNVLALALQVAQALRSHTAPPSIGLYILRNFWMALSTLGLNLLQVQVAAVFQGSLIRFSWLEQYRLPWTRAAFTAVHIVLCFGMYLSGWVPGFGPRQSSYKLYSILYGFYTLFVAMCGVALNTYLLVSVQRNTMQRISKEGGVLSLATLGSESLRPLQGLIGFVIALDLIACVTYVASIIYLGDDTKSLSYNCYVQISLAFLGLHMSAETIMFERVVMIFRNKMPKEYVASVGIDNWHLGADVEATLEDMNATSGRTQQVDTLTRLEAIALRQVILSNGVPASPTASKSGFEPIDKTALSSTQLPSTSNASIATIESEQGGATVRRADPSSSEAGGSSKTRGQ